MFTGEGGAAGAAGAAGPGGVACKINTNCQNRSAFLSTDGGRLVFLEGE